MLHRQNLKIGGNKINRLIVCTQIDINDRGYRDNIFIVNTLPQREFHNKMLIQQFGCVIMRLGVTKRRPRCFYAMSL
ncbi:hypothetical protein S96127_1757 [Yersinia pestis]|nr:hypothetical protein S96127_1757 [Yersinia pestis]